ncbi:hypothetical protein CCHR01_19308 [Colletotrichum chrysophilum]|uniref:Uncharacterized protein n=1 Tax=Colletotrichum chrysophilum TaxID=1836956 RepID=A0AAD9EAJ4_9PEZI|nr:hypothetical protein CCHR01_19308 [Colletotrichum chrysophilum]
MLRAGVVRGDGEEYCSSSSSSTGGTCRVKREWSSVTVTAVVAFFFGYGGLNVGYLRVRRASGQGKVDEVRPFPRSSKASSVCVCVRAC